MPNNTNRFSKQNQQGQTGQLQVSARLISFGWPTSVPTPDLGEDLIVHVWNNGRATGVTFHVQVKSVTDLGDRIKGQFLSYPFDTKDLTHWEEFRFPVVLVVWDVNKSEGKWILVEEAIAQLDKRVAGWRAGRRKPTVHIPVANTLDNSGLEKLRIEIGTRVMPLLMKDRTLHMSFTGRFPDTLEGKAALENMKRAFEEGEAAEISGEYIQDIKFDEWWAGWFHPSGFRPNKIAIGTASDPTPVYISIEFIGHNGDAIRFENVVFYRRKVGIGQVTLEGEALRGLLAMTVVFQPVQQPPRFQFTWTLRAGGGPVSDAKALVDFADILEQGGHLVLGFGLGQSDGRPQPFPSSKTGITPELKDLIRKLYVVQNRTGHLLTLPASGISVREANLIDALFQILSTGSLLTESATIYEFELPAPEVPEILGQFSPTSPQIELRLEYLNASVQLFGENISLGPMGRSISGELDKPIADYIQLATQLRENDNLVLVIHDAIIVDLFKNWLPSAAP